MLSFIGANYFFCAASYLVAYQPGDVLESAFEMFSKEGTILRYLVYFFMCNNITTYIGNTIFTVEMLENIPTISRMVKGEDGVIHRAKITALRISLWAFMVFLSAYSNNIIDVLNFAGSGFTPMVSSFGPLYYFYGHVYANKRELSQSRKIHDAVYFIVALVTSIWGLIDLFSGS